MMETNDQAVLCYITHPWAYFTTQPLAAQWGDDWDDAPYEHNAGEPYTYATHNRERGEDPWSVIKVAFECAYFDTPDAWTNNSQFQHSVMAINALAVPWLTSARHTTGYHGPIWAGTTLREFVRRVREVRGGIWVPLG